MAGAAILADRLHLTGMDRMNRIRKGSFTMKCMKEMKIIH
jgi:hypothetical protein